MAKRMLFALLVSVVFSTSCFYGNFQGARTIGEGRVNARSYIIVPAYFDAKEKKKMEDAGMQVTDYMAGFYVQYGATRRFDVGLQTSGTSFGFHVKWQATPGHTLYNFAPILWMNYIWGAQILSPKISLVNSIDLSKSAQLYLAYEGFYAPQVDYSQLFSGTIDWENAQKRWFDAVALGIDVTFGRSGGLMSPFGLSVELSYPIANVRAKMLFFGLAFSY